MGIEKGRLRYGVFIVMCKGNKVGYVERIQKLSMTRNVGQRKLFGKVVAAGILLGINSKPVSFMKMFSFLEVAWGGTSW